uniref:Uncharacterized protein n=1 Tax=Sinocyclocheilus grahami TaxID=75366 RepID=A0A672MCA9_SINGR
MPCHNQQLNNSESPEHAAKHVRFARSSPAAETCQDDPCENPTTSDIQRQIGPQLKLLPLNDQIRELQTIIRDKTTSRGDFVFCADRLVSITRKFGVWIFSHQGCTWLQKYSKTSNILNVTRNIYHYRFYYSCTGARSIVQEFPDITILTTEVHAVAPTHFGQRYFGTD